MTIRQSRCPLNILFILFSVSIVSTIVPSIAFGQSFNDLYKTVKKAIDTGEETVDTANQALDKVDEITDIAKEIKRLIDAEVKEYQPLTKADVMKLWLSDVPRSTIIEVIKRRKCGFEISPDEIIYLESKQMSKKIIQAMVKHSIYQSACRRLQLNHQSKQRVNLQRVTGIDFDGMFATYLAQNKFNDLSFADYAYGKKITETNVGMGLTIAGGILNATGGVLGPWLISKQKNSAAIAVMVPTLTVGTSLLIPGLVLWIRGHLQSERIYDYIDKNINAASRRHKIRFAGLSPVITNDNCSTRTVMATFVF